MGHGVTAPFQGRSILRALAVPVRRPDNRPPPLPRAPGCARAECSRTFANGAAGAAGGAAPVVPVARGAGVQRFASRSRISISSFSCGPGPGGGAAGGGPLSLLIGTTMKK